MYVIRGLLALKVFKQSRNMVYMTSVITQEMLPFMLALVGRVFLFTLVNLIADRFDKDPKNQPRYLDFGKEFALTYMVLFGDNPDTQNLSTVRWIILFFQTVFINIVMLNLLISVIMNSFDRMKSIEKATEYKAMAAMLCEVETNQSWNRKKGYRRFLHIFRYAEGEKTDTDEWNGKVRFITNKIENLQLSIENLTTEIRSKKL